MSGLRGQIPNGLAGRADWHQLGDRAKCASQIGGSRTAQRAGCDERRGGTANHRGNARQASRRTTDKQPAEWQAANPHWLQSEAARTPIGQGAGNRRWNANWASRPTMLKRSNEEQLMPDRASAELAAVGPHEPRLGRLRQETAEQARP